MLCKEFICTTENLEANALSNFKKMPHMCITIHTNIMVQGVHVPLRFWNLYVSMKCDIWINHDCLETINTN